MPSSAPTSPKVSADQVIALSDAGLVQYMIKKRLPDGRFDLDNIEGWDKLPKDERDKLGEKLRVGAGQANDALQCRPVDRDRVTARLLEISANNTLPLSFPEPDKSHPYYGTVWYLNILAEGRRPLPDERPLADEEMVKENDAESKSLIALEDDGGFLAYVEAVQQRLTEHGLTQTFQLNQDQARQDKLTTWIEYLCCEYCWYDRYNRVAKELQAKYDEAWKQLVDSGFFRPGETDEYLRTNESSIRGHKEVDTETKAFESAKSAAKAALAGLREAMDRPRGSGLEPAECDTMMKAVLDRLEKATASLKSIKRRVELIIQFVQETWDYQGAKKDAERHSILLRWIVEQVPLIEAELNEPKGSHTGRGKKRRPRPSKRGPDDVTSVERPSKRSRIDRDAARIGVPQVSGTPPTRRQPSADATEVPLPLAIPRQLRRSARIAARCDPF
ncbi:hypothetical protein CDD83_8779 [Cordyceps sp. RAO-2017]|nr:hypothetical protein CDD83_8779 [Cordyceps sp. RAO-2017]